MANTLFIALAKAGIVEAPKTPKAKIFNKVARDLSREARRLRGKAIHNKGAVKASCERAAKDRERAAQIARAKAAEARYHKIWG